MPLIRLRYLYLGISGLILAGMLVLGWWMYVPQVVSNTTKVEDAATLDKSHIRIRTVKKPDGTTTTVRDVQKNVNTKVKTKTRVQEQTVGRTQTRYEVGGGAIFSLPGRGGACCQASDYYLKGGVRVLGPVWMEGQYRIKEKSVGLGLKLEF